MEWPSPRVSRENSVGKGEEEEEGGEGGRGGFKLNYREGGEEEGGEVGSVARASRQRDKRGQKRAKQMSVNNRLRPAARRSTPRFEEYVGLGAIISLISVTRAASRRRINTRSSAYGPCYRHPLCSPPP